MATTSSSAPTPSQVEAGYVVRRALEVDRLDARTHEGWSVVVPVRAEEVVPASPVGVAAILALPLEAWTGQKQRRFRIVADRITRRTRRPSLHPGRDPLR